MPALCVQDALDARLQDYVIHDQTSKAIARQCKEYSRIVFVGQSSGQT